MWLCLFKDGGTGVQLCTCVYLAVMCGYGAASPVCAEGHVLGRAGTVSVGVLWCSRGVF